MTNSILIGKDIYFLLSNNDTLKNLVDNKIFPLVAELNTTYPFIIYERNNISAEGTKDGYYEDNVSFTITVVSDKYENSLDIANEVRKSLEKRRIKTDNLDIYYTSLTNISEEYDSNAYVLTLTFECKTH